MTNRAILLIEDNPGDVRWLFEMFDEQGWSSIEVTAAKNIGQVERLLRERSFDIILLDLGLPDAHGLEAVRRAHAVVPHVPLVVLSGIDDEFSPCKPLKEGAQDYLIKGQIDARGLVRAMCYAIERKGMEEALLGEKERAQG